MAVRHEALGKPTLKVLQVLQELQLAEEAAAVEGEVREMLEAARATAEGEAGDSGKYEKAAVTVENRWRLFLAVQGYSAAMEPTVSMAEEFAAFMFKTRQYRSRADKTGLGDSAVLLARYTLTQKVFPKIGYASWQGLSGAELRERAKPFSERLADTWVRMRRTFPEMQSSSKPFVKEKKVV